VPAECYGDDPSSDGFGRYEGVSILFSFIALLLTPRQQQHVHEEEQPIEAPPSNITPPVTYGRWDILGRGADPNMVVDTEWTLESMCQEREMTDLERYLSVDIGPQPSPFAVSTFPRIYHRVFPYWADEEEDVDPVRDGFYSRGYWYNTGINTLTV
jgi:hypothetical protein